MPDQSSFGADGSRLRRASMSSTPAQPGRTPGLKSPEIPVISREPAPTPLCLVNIVHRNLLDSSLNPKTPPGRRAITFVAGRKASRCGSKIFSKRLPAGPNTPANRTRLFRAAAETLPGCGRSGPAGAGGPGAWPPSGLPCGHRRTGVVSLCHRSGGEPPAGPGTGG